MDWLEATFSSGYRLMNFDIPVIHRLRMARHRVSLGAEILPENNLAPIVQDCFQPITNRLCL